VDTCTWWYRNKYLVVLEKEDGAQILCPEFGTWIIYHYRLFVENYMIK
jgi:hypothetical protein